MPRLKQPVTYDYEQQTYSPHDSGTLKSTDGSKRKIIKLYVPHMSTYPDG